MNLKKIAATGVMAALLVSMAATGAVASETPSSSSITCLPGGAPDTWPARVEGAPGRSPGVTAWHDTSGWHVRVTHNTLHDRVFSGVVRSGGELTDVAAVRLEHNDHVKVGPGKHTIAFRFNNYGRTDGFDFHTSCAPSLTFLFLSNGHKVPTAKISVGRAGAHPGHNPFTVTRRA